MEFKMIFICLSLLINLIQGQVNKIIEIGQNITDTIDDSKQTKYYQFTVNENPSKNDIIITVFPKDQMENFCDPDLYISKTITTPGQGNATWSATSYGEDSIVIPKDQISDKNTFYIGIVVYSKCKYDLSVNFLTEREISSERNFITISKGVNYLGYFWNNQTDASSILIATRSFSLGEYRLYVSTNDTPKGDQNSISGQPGWFEGQYVKINKNDNVYCTKCKVNVLITTEETIPFTVILNYAISGKIIPINTNNRWPLLGLINSDMPVCYSYLIDNNNKNENLIISITSFSGGLNKLYVNPWLSLNSQNLTKAKQSFSLNDEEIIKISPDDRRANNLETGDIYMCVDSKVFYDSSFFLKVIPESKTEEFQRANFILNGVPLNGYLPSEKVTRYRVVDFTTTANITLKLETVSGNPVLYANPSETSYEIYTKNSLNGLKTAQTNGNIQTIKIFSSDNECHKINKNSTKPDFRCGVSAIIYCGSIAECVYRISYKLDQTTNLLREHQIQNHLIQFNGTDYYKFRIEDDYDIENVTIILNSINGDADLYTSRTIKKPSLDAYDKISTSPAFSPDIVVYSKKETQGQSLKGDYYIAVYSYSYTYYSIMYYTTKSNDKIDVKNDTATFLVNGLFFRDYVNPQKRFKIYRFNTNFLENDKKDISIVISPEKGYYDLYLYDDKSKIQYTTSSYGSNYSYSNYNFTGFVDSAYSYTGQLSLNKTSSYYKAKGSYYVVVYSSGFFYYDQSNGIYSVGYKTEDSSFVLSEGLPISYFLEDSYKSVSFVYYHFQTNETLLLSVGNNYGKLQVYYDFAKLNNDFSNATYKTMVNENFQISPSLIKEKCQNKNICPIHIGFKTGNNWGERFTIVGKTVNKRPMLYTSGILQNHNLFIDEIHYYYVRIGKEDKGMISIGFVTGRMTTFVNILPPSQLNQPFRNWDYPTPEKNKFLSENSFYGQNIMIKSEDLTICEPQCILLVGVKGVGLGYGETSIRYTFKFTSKVTPIYDNIPIIGSLMEGETNYYTFHANDKVENIYISANANNAGGDTDIMINYGQTFPTRDLSDWRSFSSWAEFIDINKEDSYFSTKGLKINKSNYTIAIYGYTNTTYTIFVTTNPNKILPVGNYHSSSCSTNKKNSYCFFRYTELYNTISPWNPLSYIDEILASTEFLYGNGTIFAKVYDSADIDIYKDVPTKENSDFSSSEQNYRNFIRIDTKKLKEKFTNNNTKYTLLFSVYCDNPCFMTLNTDTKYTGSTKYLNSYRENLVYVQKKSTVSMIFYYYEKNNMTIQTGLFGGSGSFELFANENYNKNTSLANFTLNQANTNNYQFISENHHGQLYLVVTAGSDDSAFFIKLSNYHNWTNIVIGKSQSYVSQYYNDFLAYFYFPKIYNSITINLHPKDHNTAATMRVNIVKVNKNKSFKSMLTPPNEENTQYKASTDYNLQSATLKINNTWKNYDEKDNFVCLISITFFKYIYNSTSNYTWDPFVNATNSSSLFTLTVSSEQNDMSMIELSPNIAYTSVLDLTQGKFDMFDLKPTYSDNNILRIEISNCRGNVKYMLSERVNKPGSTKEEIEESKSYQITNYRGKKVLTTRVNAGVNHYLKIFPDPIEIVNQCRFNNNKEGCIEYSSVSYTIKYVSGKSGEIITYSPYQGVELVSFNENRENVLLSWNKMMRLKEDDPTFESVPALANYTVFYSFNQEDYQKMQSVCYLIHYTNRELGHSQTNSLQAKLHPNKRYYMNVLANMPDNEQFAYSPFEIIITEKGTSLFVMILAFILIIFLGYAVFYLYKKYTVTKKRLDYEMQDVRNMANVSKTDDQINEINKKRQSNKYATLTEDTNSSKI